MPIRMGMPAYSTTPIIHDSGRTSPLRNTWERCVHWVVGARPHRVICLVMGIWLINGFDLALTLLAHEQGLLEEQNPVARL